MGRLENKTCEVCGKEYKPKSHNQKYCSKECRAKATNRTAHIKVELPEGMVIGPEDVFNEEQMEKFNNATEKQRKWVMVFLQTGDSDKAVEEAYDTTTQAARYQIAHKLRLKFGITVQDIYRAFGITENKLAAKTVQLLDAKKLVRTYKKGDMMTEEESEDTFAISKGIDHATKMLRIDPGQKILHGEDRENPFNSLADALLAIKDGRRLQQRPEEAPNAK